MLSLGDQATPKRILKYMSVPGLTREMVSSHLQRYRKAQAAGKPFLPRLIREMPNLNSNELAPSSTTLSKSEADKTDQTTFSRDSATATPDTFIHSSEVALSIQDCTIYSLIFSTCGPTYSSESNFYPVEAVRLLCVSS